MGGISILYPDHDHSRCVLAGESRIEQAREALRINLNLCGSLHGESFRHLNQGQSHGSPNNENGRLCEAPALGVSANVDTYFKESNVEKNFPAVASLFPAWKP